MRGEILIAEAILDENGEVVTPAQYNIPPTTSAGLLSDIEDDFSSDFTPTQVESILTRMVQYSKNNGTGTWPYYKTEVVK